MERKGEGREGKRKILAEKERESRVMKIYNKGKKKNEKTKEGEKERMKDKKR